MLVVYTKSLVLSRARRATQIEDTIHNVITAKTLFRRFLAKVWNKYHHYHKFTQTFKVDKGLHIK